MARIVEDLALEVVVTNLIYRFFEVLLLAKSSDLSKSVKGLSEVAT
jgi:hypothetical protein